MVLHKYFYRLLTLWYSFNIIFRSFIILFILTVNGMDIILKIHMDYLILD